MYLLQDWPKKFGTGRVARERQIFHGGEFNMTPGGLRQQSGCDAGIGEGMIPFAAGGAFPVHMNGPKTLKSPIPVRGTGPVKYTVSSLGSFGPPEPTTQSPPRSL